ncbi:hypothetical protein APASM_4293 [Actinosynnema pretiosum subsp. pretiosum]|nr:hypothetical protein APASM_4293 [Actinosynnema pretiosum subsp. pretiosum]
MPDHTDPDLVHRMFPRLGAVQAEALGTSDLFARIYADETWRSERGQVDASLSGPGSDLVQTAVLRAELPELVAELGVRSFLDLPCGDLFWMSRTPLDVERYIGADIVPAAVERNRELHAAPGREFLVLDLVNDELPQVDLVFTRDCLVHLCDADVRAAIANVKRSGARYFAATTFPGRTNWPDITTGGWRPLNLAAAPFDLPEPVRVITEGCTERYLSVEDGREVERSFEDKSIGVWAVDGV